MHWHAVTDISQNFPSHPHRAQHHRYLSFVTFVLSILFMTITQSSNRIIKFADDTRWSASLGITREPVKGATSQSCAPTRKGFAISRAWTFPRVSALSLRALPEQQGPEHVAHNNQGWAEVPHTQKKALRMINMINKKPFGAWCCTPAILHKLSFRL